MSLAENERWFFLKKYSRAWPKSKIDELIGRRMATSNSIEIQVTSQDEGLPKLSSLGARVRYLRNKLQLSQTELAKRSGVSQPLISELEAEKAHTSGRTASLAASLGVSAYWLETGRTSSDQVAYVVENEDMLTIPILYAPGNCGS